MLSLVNSFSSHLSWAQNASRLRLKTLKQETLKQEAIQTGTVIIYAFRDGEPFGDVQFIFQSQAHGKRIFSPMSGGDGVTDIVVNEGEFRLAYRLKGQTASDLAPIDGVVKVLADETTEVIVNFAPSKPSSRQASKTLSANILSPYMEVFVPKKNWRYSSNNEVRSSNLQILIPVRGRVTDESNNQPLVGARVYIQGRSDSVVTDRNGFFVLDVPSGPQTLSVIYQGYTLRVVPVDVVTDQQNTTEILMSPAGLKMEEYVVLAPSVKGSVSSLLELRKASSSVADVIGAEEIAKSGDSDAASSLKRVTGLSLVDGKYVYVRGLGERYSNTLFNGIALPSPDLSRRVVPLDMFPTKILESMVIQKSYSPDMPAEFGGGVIQINSKSLPEKFFMKIATSLGTEESYGEEYSQPMGSIALRQGEGLIPESKVKRLTPKTYRGGSLDWLGKDDGTRKLPDSVRKVIRSGRNFSDQSAFNPKGLTQEEKQKLARDFNQEYTPKEDPSDPMPSLTVATGDRYGKRAVKVGWMTSFLYDSDWEQKEKFKQALEDNQGLKGKEPQNIYLLENEINLSGTIDLGLRFNKNHQLSAGGVILRKTSKRVEQRDRIVEENATRDSALSWVERQLVTRQLRGEHGFDFGLGSKGVRLNMDWYLSDATATRDEPNRVEYYYQDVDKDGIYSFAIDRDNGLTRTFSELDDHVDNIGADFSVFFNFFNRRQTQVKLGTSRLWRQRSSDTLLFGIRDRRSDEQKSQQNFAGDELEEIAREDGIILHNRTTSTDKYHAGQQLQASYIKSEVPVFHSWKLMAGVRHEHSLQSVGTYDPARPEQAVNSRLETSDVLPVYALTYEFNKDLQIRTAYSETLSRPDFRELSPAPYTDPLTGDIFEGNENLVHTTIQNLDWRIEWYPTAKESLSLALFRKTFKNPIEVAVQPGGDEKRRYENANAAQNNGVEIELRKNLAFAGYFWRHWTFVANYAWIQSEVTLDEFRSGDLTSENRPLQGQSPYVANFQLQFDNDKVNFGVLYNMVGERVVGLGRNSLPDVIEDPVHQLDFVFGAKVAKNYRVGLKLKNLLDPVVSQSRGDITTLEYRRGRAASLSLSASFE